MRVAINIAAFNEGPAIKSVIEAAKPYGAVYVVDDGSSDDTSAIARAAGAHVLRHPFNLGQGAAIITGFKASLADPVDIIVSIDADGQHSPTAIPLFVSTMLSTGADMVVGSRVAGSNHDAAPWARRFFLKPLTMVLNGLTGYELSDAMCGFRAYRAESLRRILPVLDQILEPQYFSAEMFMRFARLGFAVSEIPVDLADRKSGASTKGLFRYGVGVTRAIIGTLLNPTKAPHAHR